MSPEIVAGSATISPRELQRRRESGAAIELIDVRTPVEYEEVHADLARLVPLDRLDPQQVLATRTTSDAPLYVICRSGSRAKQAIEKFRAIGFENLVNVEGGTLAWEQAGLPVVRGRKTISLERQVRIAAGLLGLAGTLLGAFASPWFLIVPGFVGAGMTFAGITDTCGMGMILARMPWNQLRNKEVLCPPRS